MYLFLLWMVLKRGFEFKEVSRFLSSMYKNDVKNRQEFIKIVLSFLQPFSHGKIMGHLKL